MKNLTKKIINEEMTIKFYSILEKLKKCNLENDDIELVEQLIKNHCDFINCDCEFETVIKPVMKYLAENHHPHTKIQVDSSTAELLEGIKSVVTYEFIVD